MRALRTGIVVLLVTAMSTSALADDLNASVAKAAQQQAQQREPPQVSSKAMIWTGSALFVGGMAVGLFAFINNKNGEFSEFGEANAVNKPLGAAGIGTAFAGGVLIFLGRHRAQRAPTVTVGPGRATVTKQVSW